MSDPIADLETLTTCIREASGPDEVCDPTALTFLLRRYRATGHDDLRDVLGAGLARALDRHHTAVSCDDRARWLRLFVDAAALSTDDRLRTAVADLVLGLRREWGHSRNVADLVTSIDTCLTATDVFDVRELVPKAIDELEHVVSTAYRPGAGIAHLTHGAEAPGRQLGVQIRAASALLTAYVGTGRLPYGMLAEELMQFARRTWWDGEHGLFRGGDVPDAARFGVNCEAARVLCRLASLHHDDDYRHVAVIAADADYRADAARILHAHASDARARGLAAAIYGLALAEWLNLQ